MSPLRVGSVRSVVIPLDGLAGSPCYCIPHGTFVSMNINKKIIMEYNNMSIIDWSVKEKTIFVTWLRSHLAMGDMFINFIKKDGSVREMHCTLKDVPEYERVTEQTSPRKTNDDVMAVFDLEKEEWRSFRIDSIKSVRFELGGDTR